MVWGGGSGPEIFVLSDQSFPSGLAPMAGSGGCVHVIRQECCSLNELADLFADLTTGCSIPVGTVVLVASFTHLASVPTPKT
jgi:hypothetical protein